MAWSTAWLALTLSPGSVRYKSRAPVRPIRGVLPPRAPVRKLAAVGTAMSSVLSKDLNPQPSKVGLRVRPMAR